MPGSTPDLVIPFAVLADPLVDWPPLSQSMAERIEALIKGVQVSVGEGLTGDGSATTPLAVKSSGIWGQNLDGNAPLDIYGPIAQTISTGGAAGQSIYLDANGELRAPPLVISGPDVNRLNADLVAVYPLGPSVLGLSTALATSGGWPLGYSAIVLTNKRDVGVANQLWFQNTRVATEIKIKYRSGDANGWTPWVDLLGKDSGWVIGGSGSSVFVPRATQFTLLNSWARLRNGQVNFMLTGTMKVASAVPSASGDIPNTELGTMATQFISSAPSDQMVGPGASARTFGAVMQTVSGKVYICSVGGTSAIAVGETISVGGSYLID